MEIISEKDQEVSFIISRLEYAISGAMLLQEAPEPQGWATLRDQIAMNFQFFLSDQDFSKSIHVLNKLVDKLSACFDWFIPPSTHRYAMVLASQ